MFFLLYSIVLSNQSLITDIENFVGSYHQLT